MSSIWEFVKRHKGKFVAGSQSCDKALTESIGDVKNVIRSRYPVENLVETVREPDLTPEEKVRIFEDIKLKSIARIISISFAYPLIIVASKTQKSIVCAETCKNVEKSRQRVQNPGLINYVQSLIFGEDQGQKTANFTDPKVQQVFLNCIQFLTTSGLSQLFNRIDGIVEQLLIDWPLGKSVTVSDFENFFEVAVSKVEHEIGINNFADLIVPITNVHTRFNDQDASHLEGLLTRFVTLLQLPSCRQLMNLFVRRFIFKVVQFLRDDLKDVNQPVAKFLPAIADAFSVEARSQPDSAFQDCLQSHELHRFALMAFGAEEATRATRKIADDFGLD
uniref:Peroxisomal assembly protein PEX3 n=1 Tax=Panagrolaimus sp. JU765 TaxID=591449 RepID=A0AC34R260_9BILA